MLEYILVGGIVLSLPTNPADKNSFPPWGKWPPKGVDGGSARKLDPICQVLKIFISFFFVHSI